MERHTEDAPPMDRTDRVISIVLADDHPVVRIGVRNMLAEEGGFSVVGEASDGDEAITQTLEQEPDILLLDLAMPRLPGLEAMRAIMNGTPTVKIILLTSTITRIETRKVDCGNESPSTKSIIIFNLHAASMARGV